MDYEYRKMPRRGTGFQDGAVIATSLEVLIQTVEDSTPFVAASTIPRNIGACRSRDSFLVAPFFHYPVLLPHVVIPNNLGRTDGQRSDLVSFVGGTYLVGSKVAPLVH